MPQSTRALFPSRAAHGTSSGLPNPHGEPLAAHHPYPGWHSPGGGDASALAPYVDDDPFAPVSTGLNAVGGASTVAEAAFPASHALHGLSGVTAPLEILSGTMDIMSGVRACQAGHCERGAVDIDSGILGTGAGIAGFAHLAGVVGPEAALALGVGELGVHAVDYGSEKIKEHGWLHDRDGNAENVSEWAADNGQRVEDWFADRGHPTAGKIFGLGTVGVSSIEGAGLAIAGAGLGMGEALVDDAPYRVMQAAQHRGNGAGQ